LAACVRGVIVKLTLCVDDDEDIELSNKSR